MPLNYFQDTHPKLLFLLWGLYRLLLGGAREIIAVKLKYGLKADSTG